jgi:hypothetical protein
MNKVDLGGFLQSLEDHGLSLDVYRDGYKTAGINNSKLINAIIKIASKGDIAKRLTRIAIQRTRSRGGLTDRLNDIKRGGSYLRRKMRALS